MSRHYSHCPGWSRRALIIIILKIRVNTKRTRIYPLPLAFTQRNRVSITIIGLDTRVVIIVIFRTLDESEILEINTLNARRFINCFISHFIYLGVDAWWRPCWTSAVTLLYFRDRIIYKAFRRKYGPNKTDTYSCPNWFKCNNVVSTIINAIRVRSTRLPFDPNQWRI